MASSGQILVAKYIATWGDGYYECVLGYDVNFSELTNTLLHALITRGYTPIMAT